jgi:phosphoserine phosphatase RsbU/P
MTSDGQWIPRVLVIDDDLTSGMMLEGILGKEGFRVARAQSGEAGRELAIRHRPDLILLDVNMPGEDGITACKKMKSDARMADTPVVFVSAMEDVSFKVEGFNAGGVDYVTKPYNPVEVLARVRLHIRLHQAYRALIESHIERLRPLAEAQRSMMVRPEEIPEARFAVSYAPMQEAGGDFYDVLRTGEQVFDYIVADVCGHDLGVSLATSALKALTRQNLGMLCSPLENMTLLNRVMRSVLHEGQYVTLIHARLNRSRNRLSLLSAGHPEAILMRAGGTADSVAQTGDVLGSFDVVTFESREMDAKRGDRFFLFTDGLIEWGWQGGVSRRQGVAALLDLCGKTRHLPLADAVEEIAEATLPDRTVLRDDAVLLGVEV